MTKQIKSGQELLDEFFSDITNLTDVDQETAQVIMHLYVDGKLTPTTITNALQLAREAGNRSEAKQN